MMKMDLAEACNFDLATARRNINGVRPGGRILEVSGKTGAGMDVTVALLESRRQHKSRMETP